MQECYTYQKVIYLAFVAFGERLAVQAYKAVCKNDILILQFSIRAYFIYAYHGFNEILVS